MQQGYICCAGIDVESLRHVRPLSAGGRLRSEFLYSHGGPFDIAVVLELGSPLSLSKIPQVEDKIINPSEIQRIGTFRPRQFWDLLTQIAQSRLREIFGQDLMQIGSSSCGVEVGKGKASLGCLIPKSLPTLYIRGRSDRADQVRMGLTDGVFSLDCGVTDIRLYSDDHITPDESAVKKVARRVKDGVEVILSMGLTRAYASSADFDPVHWLQVNNVHLEDDPTWQVR
jgi:hypothetical protein